MEVIYMCECKDQKIKGKRGRRQKGYTPFKPVPTTKEDGLMLCKYCGHTAIATPDISRSHLFNTDNLDDYLDVA